MTARNASTACLLGLLLFRLAQADNPVVSHRHLADPNGFVFDDRIYAICSNDDDNVNGYDMKSAVAISTADLVNWTDHGDVFRTTRDAKWAAGSYAPTAIPARGKVYLYFPNIASGVGVLTADRPEGPYKDPLGKALVSGPTLCPMAWCFDPVVFVDDNGAPYLVWGGGTPYGNNFMGIALNADMISLKGSAVRISVPNSFEGPFVHKYRGNYYLHYPIEGNSNLEYSMSGTSPISGYARKGVVLPNPTLGGRNINQYNNSHASIFEFRGSWYMMYHDRRLPTGSTYKRDVSIDKLEYNADGTMKQVVVTAGMPQLGTFNPYDSIPAATMSRQTGIKASFSAATWVNYLVPQSSGAWIRLSGVDFKDGARSLLVNASSTTAGATLEVRAGSETGPLAGTCNIAKTASITAFATSECALTGLQGIKDIHLRFVGMQANAHFAWYRFVSSIPVSNSGHGKTVAVPATTGRQEVEVYDLRGRLVLRHAADPGRSAAEIWKRNSDGLPAGAYVVRIRSAGMQSTRRFVRTASDPAD